MRDYYDPQGRFEGLSTYDFFDQVSATRHRSPIRRLGQVSGDERILVEATHCLLDGSDGIPLRVGQLRQRQIVSDTLVHADMVGRCILEVADDVALEHAEREKRIGARLNPLPNKTLLAGKILAAVGHSTKDNRRSGRPFITHPTEVAHITRIAFRKWQDGNKDPDLQNAAEFLSDNHDAPEDNIDAYGKYVGLPTPVTPLVAESILRLQQVEHYRKIAKTLVSLMRVKGLDGNQLPYETYVDKGIHVPGLTGTAFVIVKSADNTHNLSIEPDMLPIAENADEKARRRIEKVRANWERYKLARISLKNAAAEIGVNSYGTDVGWIVESIFAVTPREIARESAVSYHLNVNSVARTVHKRMESRSFAVDREIA